MIRISQTLEEAVWLFLSVHLLAGFPYRPVNFPETNQRGESQTIHHILGAWAVRELESTLCAVGQGPGGTGILAARLRASWEPMRSLAAEERPAL